MAFNWDDYETEQITTQQQAQQSSFNWGAYKEEKPVASKRTLPDKTKLKYLPTGELDTKHFKNNIDAIYDIPQVERPKSNVLMDSDGVIKILNNNNIPQNLTPDKQAEVARIKAEFNAKNKEINREHRKAMGRIGGGAILSGISALPVFNIPYVGTGLGGALFEAGNAIMEGKSGEDIAKKASEGFIIGETVGAIPYVGKYAGKTKVGQAALKGVSDATKRMLEAPAVQTVIKATEPVISKLNTELTKPRSINIKPITTSEGVIVDNKFNGPPSYETSVKAEIVKPTQAVTEATVNNIDNLTPALKEDVIDQVVNKYKPSGLKSTMEKAGTLPKELKNKNITYQVLNNEELVNRAKEAVRTNSENLYDDLINKTDSESKDFKNYVLNAEDVANAKELVTKYYQEGKTERALNLTEKIIQSASKTGQALQAYSLWGRTTPDGAVAYAQKWLNRYNKAQNKNLKLNEEQVKDIRNLAQKVQETAEGTRENDIAIAQMQKYIADLTPVDWSKKYDTYRYVNMLLSTKSRTKDFVLTGLNAVDTAIDETIANGLDFVRSKLTNSPRLFSGLKPREWGQGFAKGFKEGAEDVAMGINTNRSGEVGRYGIPIANSFNFKPVIGTKWEGLTNNPVANAFNNAYAGGERALKYALQVPDRAFYEARYASSLADQMAAAGVDTPTNEMIQQANKEALEAVFQDNSWVSRVGNSLRNTGNELSTGVENFLNLPEGRLPRLGNFIAPFVTTPANVVNTGIKNTIGGSGALFKLLTDRTPQGLRDAEMLAAKNIKGLGVMLGIGEGIHQGTIKSNIGEDNYREDAVTGLKPSSIVIGDKAISFKDYPQLTIPINAYLGAKEGGLSQAFANVAQSVGDVSALKALGDVMGAFQPRYGENPTAGEIGNSIARSLGVNTLSQNIPYGGELGEWRNDIDPYAREMFSDNLPEYFKNRLLNRLPVLSKTLPFKYNAVGDPTMINNIQNPIARVASEAIDLGVRNYNGNEVYDELQDFQHKIKDTSYNGKTRVALSTPARKIVINGEKVTLNNKQYSDYSSDYTKLNYILKGMALNDDEFKNMDDEEKTDYLSDIRASVEEAVKMSQFGHRPSKKLKPYTQYILDNYEDLITY